VDIQSKLPAHFRNTPCHEVLIGESGTRVFHLPGLGYLKVTTQTDYTLQPEKQRLEWLHGKLPVPEVLYFAEHDSQQMMLISEIPGIPSFMEPFKGHFEEQVIHLLAEGLRTIHQVDIRACPFDHRLDTLLDMARQNLAHPRPIANTRWRGRSVADLYAELMATRPIEDHQVFTHGDYCMPNILIAPETMTISGFIDWGHAGISDPYFDLALAARSIIRNFGEQWVSVFFEAYGLNEPVLRKISYYQLLDEFL